MTQIDTQPKLWRMVNMSWRPYVVVKHICIYYNGWHLIIHCCTNLTNKRDNFIGERRNSAWYYAAIHDNRSIETIWLDTSSIIQDGGLLLSIARVFSLSSILKFWSHIAQNSSMRSSRNCAHYIFRSCAWTCIDLSNHRLGPCPSLHKLKMAATNLESLRPYNERKSTTDADFDQ